MWDILITSHLLQPNRGRITHWGHTLYSSTCSPVLSQKSSCFKSWNRLKAAQEFRERHCKYFVKLETRKVFKMWVKSESELSGCFGGKKYARRYTQSTGAFLVYNTFFTTTVEFMQRWNGTSSVIKPQEVARIQLQVRFEGARGQFLVFLGSFEYRFWLEMCIIF